jgi:hypothetical protein
MSRETAALHCERFIFVATVTCRRKFVGWVCAVHVYGLSVWTPIFPLLTTASCPCFGLLSPALGSMYLFRSCDYFAALLISHSNVTFTHLAKLTEGHFNSYLGGAQFESRSDDQLPRCLRRLFRNITRTWVPCNRPRPVSHVVAPFHGM